MATSFGSLKLALSLAVFLVYLVMAATFESLVHPFVVLFTIPLALVGVLLGLTVTGTNVSVIVLIGAIMLVGIVVNNAIVLIDTVNQLRRAGMEKLEAVVRAGHIRLRPIVMTGITTMAGSLPASPGIVSVPVAAPPLASSSAACRARTVFLPPWTTARNAARMTRLRCCRLAAIRRW